MSARILPFEYQGQAVNFCSGLMIPDTHLGENTAR